MRCQIGIRESRIMRHLHSTKLQHLRKSTMKQTARAPIYAPRAVGSRIRNAGVVGSSPIRGTTINTTASAISSPCRISVNRRIMRQIAEQTVIFGQKETPPSAPHKYDL